MACLLAAAVHDYEHLGLNNDFLVKTGHKRAICFNDQNVNENHHAAAAFALLEKPEFNFLKVLPRKAFVRLRKLVIDLVLGTDLKYHFDYISDVKGKYKDAKEEDQFRMAFKGFLKLSDISHASKSLELHLGWTQRINAEFCQQGDRERELGMPISPFCNREDQNLPASQIGFFKFLVQPLIEVTSQYYKPQAFNQVRAQCSANLEYWISEKQKQNEEKRPGGGGGGGGGEAVTPK